MINRTVRISISNKPTFQIARVFIFVMCCTLCVSANAMPSQSGFPQQPNSDLQHLLEQRLASMNLMPILNKNKLSVTLVDITDVGRPIMAHINGSSSYYAASLPKLAILLAVYEEVYLGNLELSDSIRDSLGKMIRNSSNSEATRLYELVGPARIEEILRSDRYRFYDEDTGGGLWVGKPYAKHDTWKRDPLENLSHSASGLQVARFYFMLERGELAEPQYCEEMKSILSGSSINHKFVKGLNAHRPTAEIYRKSGTWRNYHSDSALVERTDGRTYIAVVLTQADNGGSLLEKIIVNLDQVIDQYYSR